MDIVSLVCCVVAGLLYYNTLDAGFVYDDSRAILSNQDLLPTTPLWRLLTDDFWGTPLSHSGSHGSYRPLCVLSFRLNYLAGGFRAAGFHAVNVLLHCLATGLVVRVARVLFPAGAALPAAVTGLLFAAHPIHTEAVAGLVGRADLAACVFYLLAFLCYASHVRHRDAAARRAYRAAATGECIHTCHRCNDRWFERRRVAATWCVDESAPGGNRKSHHRHHQGKVKTHHHHHHHHHPAGGDLTAVEVVVAAGRCECPRLRQWLWFAGCVVCAACAILSKETGATVLAMCAAYDALLHLSRWKRLTLHEIYNKRSGRGVLGSLCGLGLALCALLLLRLHLMGLRAPGFSTADNPGARNPSIVTRALTFAYLPVFNVFLLLWPRWLSFDWGMDAIPRVTSIFDPRSAVTLLFYYLLYRVSRSAFLRVYAPSDDSTPTATTAPVVTGKYRKQRGHRRPGKSTASGRRYAPSGSVSHGDVDTLKAALTAAAPPCPVCRHSLLDHSALCRSSNNNNSISMLGASLSCYCGGGSPYSSSASSASSSSSSSSSSSASSCSSSSSDVRSSPRYRRMPVSAVARNHFTSAQILLIALSFLAIPFLPATNLFFYVGFVVAERVLYIPSVGYCLLIGLGCHIIQSKTNRKVVVVCVALLLVAFSVRTIQRNRDWVDEESLYRAGVPINPPKAYGNLGFVLSARGKIAEAEWAFRMALKYRNNMADVHYNLGNLLQSRDKYEEAIRSYEQAIQFRPTLAVAHLNLGRLLERRGRCSEALAAYRRCSQLDGTGLKDPLAHEAARLSALLHLGRLYAEQGLHQEAMAAYQEALDTATPDSFQPQPITTQLDEARSRLQQYRTRRVAVASQPSGASGGPAPRPAHPKNRSRVVESEPWLLASKQMAPAVYQHFGVPPSVPEASAGSTSHASPTHQTQQSDVAPT